MDISEKLRKYAHQSSILNTSFEDGKVRLEDLPLITKNDIRLLKEVLKWYEFYIKTHDTCIGFTKKQISRIRYLDMYLNIPLLNIFYTEPNYKLFARFVDNNEEKEAFVVFNFNRIVKQFYRFGTESEFKWLLANRKIEMNQRAINTLISRGNIKCVKYALENGGKLSVTSVYYAAQNGHLDCIEYLHEKKCTLSTLAASAAASKGHLECLKYLHKNGAPLCDEVWPDVVRNGHLECLKYLCENGCQLSHSSIFVAVENGQLECLKYMLLILDAANAASYITNTRVTTSTVAWDIILLKAAAENGHLACLKYLYEHGRDWATKTGSAENYPLHHFILYEAMINNQLDCVKYLHEIKCCWEEYIAVHTAAMDSLECLKYAYENGYSINIEDCYKSAGPRCKTYLYGLRKYLANNPV